MFKIPNIQDLSLALTGKKHILGGQPNYLLFDAHLQDGRFSDGAGEILLEQESKLIRPWILTPANTGK
ncbi:MAG: hypothetical protein IT342_04420 [Candidatus Melainabacteria bacterium]|nr:hypothetical protein [Candidatus Melainabacteria bacterium]